ncbi:MAG: 16S rRNA (uracil(1498)-N(3))-methyltransferase [Flavobacteriales bacterium]|nr:16S rRNA (uracil(1498)-N(3))-methyltransferase [Flavobacteriales bacterium]
MQLFYAPHITETDTIFTLSKEESHHAVKVLRMTAGSDIYVTNGCGLMIRGVIELASPSSVSVRVEEILPDVQRRPYHIHIAIAPTKMNERMEWFLEKATEVGVDEITPIICHHSERRVYNCERGRRVILSAGKQSLKAAFPTLNEATSFKEFIKNTTSAAKFMAHCMEEGEKVLLTSAMREADDICVLIGPEGDFSAEELQIALSAGYIPVSLGESRLRAETAALYAVMAAYAVKSI